MNSTEIDDLIQRALNSKSDEHYFETLREIQRETRHPQLLAKCQALLTKSESERMLAAGALIALSNAEPTLRKTAVTLLCQALRQGGLPSVLSAAVMALAHFADPNSVPIILSYVNHEDEKLRRCVAHSLARIASEADFESPETTADAEGEHPSPPDLRGLIVRAMLQLSVDPDSNVRDWATFAFANELQDVDSTEIRNALRKRLQDTNGDTRDEAVLALAIRKDDSVIPVIEDLLSGDKVGELVLEAVDALGLPRLLSMAAPFRD